MLHELRLLLAPSLAAIEPACERLRDLLAASRLQEHRFEVELIARECLNNAILHGGGMRPGGKVKLAVQAGMDWIRLQVADPGSGFDWQKAIRHRRQSSARASGRGLWVMSLYAQQVEFNPRGNEVTVLIDTSKRGR